jgi:hypothetical protein
MPNIEKKLNWYPYTKTAYKSVTRNVPNQDKNGWSLRQIVSCVLDLQPSWCKTVIKNSVNTLLSISHSTIVICYAHGRLPLVTPYLHTTVKDVYEWLFWKGTQLVSIHQDSVQKCNKECAKYRKKWMKFKTDRILCLRLAALLMWNSDQELS